MSGGALAGASTGTGNQQRIELADIFRRFGPSFLATHSISARHRKVMQQITNCRTAVLGGQRQWCARCDYERFVYHSCRNRHCPKCQTAAKEQWREARKLELLPVPYFHQVFTLPHELNELMLRSESNQRRLLNLLFEATAATLLEFGTQTFGGQVGFTLVLHTWDQQLRPHVHLHCLMPSGALVRNEAEPRWVAGGNQFLFPVRGLSKMFRAKFLTGFRQLLSSHELDLTGSLQSAVRQRQLIGKLFKKPWVVYSKRPFAGPAKLLDYLSRYTHRVALTNSRLVSLKEGSVTLTWRDRRDGDRRKQMQLPAEELIGRFLTHVLPGRLMRIRHYGFLANRFKQTRLAAIRKSLGATAPQPSQESSHGDPEWLTQWLEVILGSGPDSCPCCGERLITTALPNCLAGPVEAVQSNKPRGPPG